jgi:hypothetical protein
MAFSCAGDESGMSENQSVATYAGTVPTSQEINSAFIGRDIEPRQEMPTAR